MKFKPLFICSMKTTIIFLSFSTFYVRTDTKRSKNYVNKYDPDLYPYRNVRNKTNLRITDQWLNQWLDYMKNNSTELPLEAFIDNVNITFFAGFGISQPKPWRKDDKASRTFNSNAEIVVNPDKPVKLPLPQVRGRADSPALSLISPKGCGETDVKNARIVNGKDAQSGAYPWMVAILKAGDAMCGGTIINQRWIISAAHCFMKDVNPRSYAIRVGTIDRNRGTTYKVDKLIIHERFHLDNMFNSDIALAHVNRDIQMGTLVKPVCLSKKVYEEPKTDKLLVVGWGQTAYENKELPTILQEVVLNMIKVNECAKKYKSNKKSNKIYISQLCTWNKGQDACQGDSGAPAIEYHNDVAYLVGIVSYGSTCADEFPGVYTKVSYFIDWILRTLESEEGLGGKKPKSEDEE